MALKGNAAFLVDGPSGEQVYLCNVPPRIVSTRQVQRRYTEESLSRTTRNVVTIGAPVYELTLRARFADRPHDLLALLDAAANGASITYIHDLSQPGSGTTFTLIHGDDAIEATPDPDRFGFGEYDTTLVLRSSTSFAPLLASSSVLFRYHAGGAMDTLTFSRASTAYRITRGGVLESVASDVLRTEWLDLDGDGVRETPTTLVEGERTNVLHDSTNLAAAGTAWSISSGLTVDPVTSVIEGETAWRHMNDGSAVSRNRGQSRGVLSDGPETLWLLVEQVAAVVTDWGIYDSTASDFVARGRFTWATGVAEVNVSTVGSDAFALALRLGTGPNGGTLWLISVTATPDHPGNSRTLIVYPTGVSAGTGSVIIHHVQHEEADGPSSVVVTGGSSGATRGADTLALNRVPPPQAVQIYERWVEGGTTTPTLSETRLRWQIGSSLYSGTPALHVISSSGGDRIYRLRMRHAAGDVITGTSGLTRPEIGQAVEQISVVWWEGDTLHLRLDQSIDGGIVETVQASQAGRPMPAAWAEQVAYHTGGVAGAVGNGRTWLRDWIWLRGADWTLDAVRRLLPW